MDGRWPLLAGCHGWPDVTPVAMSASLCRAILPTVRWRAMRTFTPAAHGRAKRAGTRGVSIVLCSRCLRERGSLKT